MFHNNYIRGGVNKDFRSKEMGRYVLDVNKEYSSTTARYFTVQQLNFDAITKRGARNVKNALVDLVNMANRLNRTLVIPPMRCKKSGLPFCNMCRFGSFDCFKDIVNKLKYPFKESVFFIHILPFVDFLHASKCSFSL